MSLKCKLGFHNWSNNCEKCSDCGKERKTQHDWSIDCEKCAKCGFLRKNHHDWDKNCEKCSICKKECKNQHDWNADCEKCTKCNKTRKNQHDWNKDCEKCEKCGKIRKNKHDWSKDCQKCSICETKSENPHDWSNNCEICSRCGKNGSNQHEWQGCKCKKCDQTKSVLDDGHKWKNNNCLQCGLRMPDFDDIMQELRSLNSLSSYTSDICSRRNELTTLLSRQSRSYFAEIKDEIEGIINERQHLKYAMAYDLCTALGKIGGEDSYQYLIKVLNTESKFVEFDTIISGAVSGLNYLGDKRCVDNLKDARKRDYRVFVKNNINETLRFFGILDNEHINTKELEVFTDPRDKKKYKTVKIGDQIWFAENLAYKPVKGNYWAYGNKPKNATKYGYLYDWETAKKVSPLGWHLPGDEEWTILIDNLGGEDIAGARMRETGTDHWIETNESITNESGFTALPGGNYNNILEDHFYNIGEYTGWWSSLEDDAIYAIGYFMSIRNDLAINRNYGTKTYGFSVRCIKD